MDEITLEMLAQHGYKIHESGALLNKDGNYTPSAKIDGMTYNSVASVKEYDKWMNENDFISKNGEEVSSDLSPSERKVKLSKAHLNQLKTDNSHYIPDEVSTKPEFQAAFKEKSTEDAEAGEPTFTNPRAMQQAADEGTKFENLDEETGKLIKGYEKRLRDLREEDADYKTSLKEGAETVEKGSKGTSANPFGVGAALSQLGTGLITGTMGIIEDMFSAGTGMEDKKKAREAQALDSEIKKLEKPYLSELSKKSKEHSEKIVEFMSSGDHVAIGPTNAMLLSAVNAADRVAGTIDGSLGGDLISPILTDADFYADTFTFGGKDLLIDLPAEFKLKYDIANGIPLSEGQKLLAQALEYRDELAKFELDETFLSKLSGGVAHSLSYLSLGRAGGKVATKVGAKVSKKMIEKQVKKKAMDIAEDGLKKIGAEYTEEQILKGSVKYLDEAADVVIKEISKSQKVVNKAAEVLTEVSIGSLLHVDTFKSTVQDYQGSIYVEYDKETGQEIYTTDSHTYFTVLEENNLKLDNLRDKFSNSDSYQEKQKISEEINFIEAEMAKLEAPDSVGFSFAKNAVDNSYEYFSERYFLKSVNVLGNVLGKGANKVAPKVLSKADNYRKGFYNTLFPEHSYGSNLIGGVAEEIGEEMFVQVMPSLDETWESYMAKVSELGTLEYYAHVGAQSLVMSKGGQALGWAQQNWKLNKDMFSMDKNKVEAATTAYQERKKQREAYKTLRSNNLTSKEFNDALILAGKGEFTAKDYANKIKELEESGDFASAHNLKKQRILNHTLAAMENGNGEKYIKLLKKARKNKKFGDADMAKFGGMIEVAEELVKNQNRYINGNDISKAMVSRTLTEQSIKDIERTLAAKPLSVEDKLAMDKVIEESGISYEQLIANESVEFEEGEPTQEDRRKQIADRLSDEQFVHLNAQIQKANLIGVKKAEDANISKMKSSDFQHSLKTARSYTDLVSRINKKYYKGNLTAEKFEEDVAPLLHKRKEFNDTDEKDLENYKTQVKKGLKLMQQHRKTANNAKSEKNKLKRNIFSSITESINNLKNKRADKGKKASNGTSSQTTEQINTTGTTVTDPAETKKTETAKTGQTVEELKELKEKETEIDPAETIPDNGALPAEVAANTTFDKDQAIDDALEGATNDPQNNINTEGDTEDDFDGDNLPILFSIPETQDINENEEVMNALTRWAAMYTEDNEIAPTFEDFWMYSVGLKGKKEFNKPRLRYFAAQWEFAKLGNANWEGIWRREYDNLERSTLDLLSIVPSFSETEQHGGGVIQPKVEVPVQEREVTETNAEVKKEEVKPDLIVPPELPPKSEETNKPEVDNPKVDGAAAHITPNSRKASITETKGNFAGIIHKQVQSIDGDGNIIYETIDRFAEPVLNEDNFLNIKELLHKDKNNPGDSLSVRVSNEADWEAKDENGKHLIKVAIYSKDSKGATRYVPFLEWVEENNKENLPIDEFMKTEEAIQKVPMIYNDGDNNLMYVTDAEWYNPRNMRLISKEYDKIDLDNVPAELTRKIEESRKSTRELRRQIAEGNIKSFTIKDKSGSPFNTNNDKGVEPKRLEDVASDQQIVLYLEGKGFMDLEGNAIGDDIVIENEENIKEVMYRVKQNNPSTLVNRTLHLSPTQKKDGKQHVFASLTLAKNEDKEYKAEQEDVETAKFVLFAALALSIGEDINEMSLSEAKLIAKEVRRVLGVDLQKKQFQIVNSLISLKNEDGPSYTAFSDIPIYLDGKSTKVKMTRLFRKGLVNSSGGFVAIQNTGFGIKTGLNIKKEGNSYKVSATADNYEGHLKKRLSTTLVTHNMGTDEKPAWTHAAQPTITLEPVFYEENEKRAAIKKTATVTKSEPKKELPKPKPKVEVEDKSVTNEDQILIQEARDFLESIGEVGGTSYMIPDMQDVDLIEGALNVIEGITSNDQHDYMRIIGGLINTLFDPKNRDNVSTLRSKVKKEFYKANEKNSNRLKEYEEKITALVKKYDQDTGISDILSTIREARLKEYDLENAFDELFDKSYAKQENLKFISTPKTERLEVSKEEINQEELSHEEQEVYEKNFYKSSTEEVHKDKIAPALKRVFSNITSEEIGPLGFPMPFDYDMIYNTIATYLTSPYPPGTTFESMTDALEKLVEQDISWARPVIDRLKNQSEETKKGFVSNMYKYSANAKFVSFVQKSGELESAVWDSNANDVKFKIKGLWESNFKRGPLTKGNHLNIEEMQKAVKEYEALGEFKSIEENSGKIRAWVAKFGFEFSDGTWKSLIDNGFVPIKGTKLTYSQMFVPTSKGRGGAFFDSLYKYAKMNSTIQEKKDTNFIENVHLTPFKDMNNVLKVLVDTEAKYNKTIKNITRRDGGKSISEIIHPTFLLESVNELANNPEIVETLLSTKFGEDSLLLQMLKENPEMAKILDYNETGNMALKNMDRKSPDNAKAEQLGPIDYLLHQFSLFQDTNVASTTMTDGDFDLRIAKMSTPTNSDKGRMMLLNTVVYDLYSSLFSFDSETLAFDDSLKKVLYKRLVLPELKRATTAGNSEVKGYDKGAKRFNLIPSLNLITVDGLSALDALQEMDEETFTSIYEKEITKELENMFQSEADAIVEESNAFNEANDINVDTDTLNNKKYLETSSMYADSQTKKKAAALDYVINAAINNMNIHQAMIGDPAQFYKSGVESKPNAESQNQISIDLGTNLGKRLALMVAPGIMLSDSHNESYLQIALKDNNVVAPNVEEIIAIHYGKTAIDQKIKLKVDGKQVEKSYRDVLEIYRSDQRNKENAPFVEAMKEEFSTVKAFLDIENTDAQEYTTLAEHLRVLEGLGRLSEENKNEILDKVYEKKEKLSKDEINLVLQPIKPVYAGRVFEKDSNGNTIQRTVYVKSSSFPLIRELLPEDSKLFGLMETMEKLEIKHGVKGADGRIKRKGVRASYQSANKVGAPTRAKEIDPLKKESLETLLVPNDEGTGPENALVLNRSGFRIQQDVPYADKTEVSMGTQIYKLLFGDGISEIRDKVFEMNGEMVSGTDLKKAFFNAFKVMVDYKKDGLLEELGVDPDFTVKDQKSFMENLERLLLEEGEKRGFSENIKKQFRLETFKVGGKVVTKFAQPLWLSAESNKVEAMFNAIINNRIFKQKIPGGSAVVGSNNGMTRTKVGTESVEDVTEETVEGEVVETTEETTDDTVKLVSQDILDRVDAIEDRRKKQQEFIVQKSLSSVKVNDTARGLLLGIQDFLTKELGWPKENILYNDETGISIVINGEVHEIGNKITEKGGKFYTDISMRDLIDLRYDNEIVEAKKGVSEDALVALRDKSGIVYTGDYRGERELKGNEALVPSKIQLNGKIIDLFEVDSDGNYKYIKKDGDNYTLDSDRIDPNILDYFSFRTPTSSHGTGSSIKVVGFLPAVCGDLLITPSNFVTQMGQDFDVDKLTMYIYNYVFNPVKNRIEKLSQGYINQRLDAIDSRIAKLEKEGTDSEIQTMSLLTDDAFMETLFKDAELDAMNNLIEELQDENVEIEKKIENLKTLRNKTESKMNYKMAQNDFISIHLAIYGSESPEVQKKIQKTMNMDHAEGQAEAIDKIKSKVAPTVNLLSPTYQRDKMISGSTGGDAIAIYAKAVTFNSLAQQAATGSVRVLDSEGDPKSYTIGNLKSNGELGRQQNISASMDPDVIILSGTISESLDERVNTGTDNEKAQVLGRVGITHTKAVAVDSFLVSLGLNKEITIIGKVEPGNAAPKDYDPNNGFHHMKRLNGKDVYYIEYSIPYLMSSQPIVQEYFRRLKNGGSQLSDFKQNLEEAIFEDLIEEVTKSLGEENEIEVDLTGETLVNELSVSDFRNPTQLQVIKKYKEFMQDSAGIKETQAIVDLSNLGKSMWELKEHISDFKDAFVRGSVSGLENLLGSVSTEATEDSIQIEKDFHFTPKTTQGVMVGNALALGRNLYFEKFGVFPQYDQALEKVVDTIFRFSGRTNKVKESEFIFQEIKRFLTATNNLKIYDENPEKVRDKLLFSEEGNVPLARYMSDLLGQSDAAYAQGLREVNNNKLVTSLSYDPGNEGEPHLISYDNTGSGDVNIESVHDAFKLLLTSDSPLPDLNGEPMTTKKLGQYLVAYSFATGGIVSEAIQFHKFIPIEYYQQVETDPDITISKRIQMLDPSIASWGSRNRLDNFTEQFYQHHPIYAPKPSGKSENPALPPVIVNRDGTVTLNTKETPSYIKMKKADNTFTVYKHLGEGQYRPLDNLGTFGTTEYNPDSSEARTSMKVEKAETELQKLKRKIPFNITKNDTVQSVLNNIAGRYFEESPRIGEMATLLNDLFKDKIGSTRLALNSNLTAKGKYSRNTITLNPTMDRVPETFVHEFIHSVTMDIIDSYLVDGEIDVNSPDIPKPIKEMAEVFNEYRSFLLNSEEHRERFNAFEDKVRDFKADMKTKGKSDIHFDKKDTNLYYAATDLKEFMAVSLTNNREMLEALDGVMYKGSAKLTHIQKFHKVLKRLMRLLTPREKDANYLADFIIDSNLRVIEEIAQSKIKVKPGNVEGSGKKVEEVVKNDPAANGQEQSDNKEDLECLGTI